MATPGTPPQEGSLIDGKYKVVRVIAGGGMGEVCEAIHIFLDQRVTVKTLRPEVAAAADASKWFLREAQILAKAKHPNVVRVWDFGSDRRDGAGGAPALPGDDGAAVGSGAASGADRKRRDHLRSGFTGVVVSPTSGADRKRRDHFRQ